MDLKIGFYIDDPPVLVPWEIDEEGLRRLLDGYGLRRVTDKYYTLAVTTCRGLECQLGFHFRRPDSSLSELEFFRTAYPDQGASFVNFQEHFESTFGKPTFSKEGSEGYLDHLWRLPGANIIHRVFDRFGPEEHMRIQRV